MKARTDLQPKHLGFRIAYDGSSFSGFQAQKHQKSVQDHLEVVFARVLKFKRRLHFSSRTDTGVHALDQWIMLPDAYSLWAAWSDPQKKRFRLALNSLLRERVSVWSAYSLPDDFRLSRRVVKKEYHYLVAEGPSPHPLLRHQAWFVRDSLDLHRMRSEISLLLGEHDFRAFANRSRGEGSERDFMKTIHRAEIHDEAHPFSEADSFSINGRSHRFIRFVFAADGFLYNMVRNLVGTFVEIGRGKAYSIRDILESKNRCEAGIKAPAHGLILARTTVNKDGCEILPHF